MMEKGNSAPASFVSPSGVGNASNNNSLADAEKEARRQADEWDRAFYSEVQASSDRLAAQRIVRDKLASNNKLHTKFVRLGVFQHTVNETAKHVLLAHDASSVSEHNPIAFTHALRVGDNFVTQVAKLSALGGSFQTKYEAALHAYAQVKSINSDVTMADVEERQYPASSGQDSHNADATMLDREDPLSGAANSYADESQQIDAAAAAADEDVLGSSDEYSAGEDHVESGERDEFKESDESDSYINEQDLDTHGDGSAENENMESGEGGGSEEGAEWEEGDLVDIVNYQALETSGDESTSVPDDEKPM